MESGLKFQALRKALNFMLLMHPQNDATTKLNIKGQSNDVNLSLNTGPSSAFCIWGPDFFYLTDEESVKSPLKNFFS